MIENVIKVSVNIFVQHFKSETYKIIIVLWWNYSNNDLISPWLASSITEFSNIVR